uniref:7TM GPCR serpentine receptor class x (Srx) domain-containing protein n=1 Tax=Ditylenchus dipsaci TaxID=166011 RepID=A0A915CVB5_9BILA
MIGAVYCSYPVFNFLAGVAVTAIWVAETAAEIILSLNRCLIILSRELEAKLFDGWLTYIWLSIHFSWSFNPYAGYIEDVNKRYISIIHTFHNLCIAVAIPAIYFIFFVILLIKEKATVRQDERKISRLQKMMFVQILVISSLNLVAGSVYVYMSYFVVNDLLIYFAQFCWFHIHGFPPVIYLVLNQTIRDDCKQMILTIISREQTFTIKKASALSTGAKISVK